MKQELGKKKKIFDKGQFKIVDLALEEHLKKE